MGERGEQKFDRRGMIKAAIALALTPSAVLRQESQSGPQTPPNETETSPETSSKAVERLKEIFIQELEKAFPSDLSLNYFDAYAKNENVFDALRTQYFVGYAGFLGHEPRRVINQRAMFDALKKANEKQLSQKKIDPRCISLLIFWLGIEIPEAPALPHSPPSVVNPKRRVRDA